MRSLLVSSCLLLVAGVQAVGQADRPNLVFILTDNQGDWTLGCYGNRDIRTPHIDALARGGMRFTNAFSVNAVCSPTRASFLTGLIPSQHGVHCWLGAGGAQMGAGAYCTIREFETLPKRLARLGYACGLVGKWHLGGNLRPQEGFSYWITKPHGHTTAFYDVPIIRDGRVADEPRYTTELWTDHACRFIRQNKDRPFFLFLAYNGPYGLGASLLRPTRNRHAAAYAESEMPSFPRLSAHPWLHNNRQYLNNVQAMRRYAAECSGVDDGVGEVMACLKGLGLDKRTLVVYSADQGWGGGQHGIWGMGDHTRPLHAFDETMHVPLIFRWPGVVQAGATSDAMVSTCDWMPTLLALLEAGDMPAKPPSPGRDFSPILRGRKVDWEQVVYYEFENTRAIRTADWKLIRRHPSGPDELYHLARDAGEANNLIGQADHDRQQRELGHRLDAFFARYADPQYDLWRGGRSKAGRILRSPAGTTRPAKGPPP
ncbi:MAG TPA: sulfatase-like hydrolase/transferase [Phycisphaerae bacterium]|nr:sulfatase-like hydrolase/transferase [Phycisphaerae bacterium]